MIQSVIMFLAVGANVGEDEVNQILHSLKAREAEFSSARVVLSEEGRPGSLLVEFDGVSWRTEKTYGSHGELGIHIEVGNAGYISSYFRHGEWRGGSTSRSDRGLERLRDLKPLVVFFRPVAWEGLSASNLRLLKRIELNQQSVAVLSRNLHGMTHEYWVRDSDHSLVRYRFLAARSVVTVIDIAHNQAPDKWKITSYKPDGTIQDQLTISVSELHTNLEVPADRFNTVVPTDFLQ